MVGFEVMSRDWPGGAEERCDGSQGIWCSERDLILVPFVYKSKSLPHEPACELCSFRQV